MSKRPEKATEVLRCNFTTDERLKMGDELAASHARLESIKNEEKVAAAQLKERKAGVEARISTISLQLSMGYEMRSIECAIEYDTPNANEVTYRRTDTGEVVKVRALTVDERQQEIPFDTPIAVNPEKTDEAAAEAVAQSEANAEEFFGKQDATAVDQPEPIEDGEGGEEESIEEGLQPVENMAQQFGHDEPETAAASAEKPAKGGKRGPKGFDKGTNPSAAQW